MLSFGNNIFEPSRISNATHFHTMQHEQNAPGMTNKHDTLSQYSILHCIISENFHDTISTENTKELNSTKE